MVFNPKLTVRDGLMEQEIRRATGCSTDAAGALIDREVDAIRQALSAGNQVEFPGLGRLFQQADGLSGFAAEPRIGERYAAPGLGRIPGSTSTLPSQNPTPSPPWMWKNPCPPNRKRTPPSAPSGRGKRPFVSRRSGPAPHDCRLPRLGSARHHRLQPVQPGAGTPSPFAPRIEGEDIRFPQLEAEPLPFVQAGVPDLVPVAEASMPVPRPQAISSGCSHHVIAGTFGEAARAAELARRFKARLCQRPASRSQRHATRLRRLLRPRCGCRRLPPVSHRPPRISTSLGPRPLIRF